MSGPQSVTAHEDEAPRATDVRRGNREVLVAAALPATVENRTNAGVRSPASLKMSARVTSVSGA
jgi:hypothetical protein